MIAPDPASDPITAPPGCAAGQPTSGRDVHGHSEDQVEGERPANATASNMLTTPTGDRRLDPSSSPSRRNPADGRVLVDDADGRDFVRTGHRMQRRAASSRFGPTRTLDTGFSARMDGSEVRNRPTWHGHPAADRGIRVDRSGGLGVGGISPRVLGQYCWSAAQVLGKGQWDGGQD